MKCGALSADTTRPRMRTPDCDRKVRKSRLAVMSFGTPMNHRSTRGGSCEGQTMADTVAGKIVRPEQMVSPEETLEAAAKGQRLEYERNPLLAETKERISGS